MLDQQHLIFPDSSLPLNICSHLIHQSGQEIGEEFVEFLEKELNITDEEVVENNDKKSSKGPDSYGTKGAASADRKEANKGGGSINDSIDEIEATLAQLKKELGL